MPESFAQGNVVSFMHEGKRKIGIVYTGGYDSTSVMKMPENHYMDINQKTNGPIHRIAEQLVIAPGVIEGLNNVI